MSRNKEVSEPKAERLPLPGSVCDESPELQDRLQLFVFAVEQGAIEFLSRVCMIRALSQQFSNAARRFTRLH